MAQFQVSVQISRHIVGVAVWISHADRAHACLVLMLAHVGQEGSALEVCGSTKGTGVCTSIYCVDCLALGNNLLRDLTTQQGLALCTLGLVGIEV